MGRVFARGVRRGEGVLTGKTIRANDWPPGDPTGTLWPAPAESRQPLFERGEAPTLMWGPSDIRSSQTPTMIVLSLGTCRCLFRLPHVCSGESTEWR
jgi:hypothetical protein